MKKLFVSVFFVFVAGFLSAQNNLIDYSSVKEYTLVGVYVHGCQLVDSNVVRLISGLPIGDKINVPGEKTSAAIDNLWKEGMFEDLRIEVAKVEGEYIWLNIIVTEMPKITVHRFVGVKKNEKEDDLVF